MLRCPHPSAQMCRATRTLRALRAISTASTSGLNLAVTAAPTVSQTQPSRLKMLRRSCDHWSLPSGAAHSATPYYGPRGNRSSLAISDSPSVGKTPVGSMPSRTPAGSVPGGLHRQPSDSVDQFLRTRELRRPSFPAGPLWQVPGLHCGGRVAFQGKDVGRPAEDGRPHQRHANGPVCAQAGRWCHAWPQLSLGSWMPAVRQGPVARGSSPIVEGESPSDAAELRPAGPITDRAVTGQRPAECPVTLSPPRAGRYLQ